MQQTSAKGWSDYFGFAGKDTSQTQVQTNDKKLDPIFMLFLDSVSQLVKMNPLSFEFEPSYLALIAAKVFTNKYFEFVQGDETPLVGGSLSNLNPNENTVMMSAFSKLEMKMHENKAFSNEWSRKNKVEFDKSGVSYWLEYFGRFNAEVQRQLSHRNQKKAALVEMRA